MASIVLDASVILAHLGGEPGSERAEAFFGDALMSAVNLSEVVAKLVERGASLGLVRAALSRYGLQVARFRRRAGGAHRGAQAADKGVRAFAGRPGLPGARRAFGASGADRG